jgi:Zn finger protein HypA/HybF involved in hydrogenase expression
MGAGFKANCACGYKGSASVGSTRAGHGKLFWYPYRCGHCMAVVSPDLLAEKLCCPECGGTDIVSYAAPSRRCRETLAHWLGSRWRGVLRLHLEYDEADGTFCPRMDKTFYLMKTGNRCPACLQNTLKFALSVQFD